MLRAVAAGVVSAAVALMSSPTAPTTSSPGAGWQASYTSPYPLPSDQVGALTSLVALPHSKVLAAGYSEAYLDGVSSPVIRLWNGHRWRVWTHQQSATTTSGYEIDSIAASSLSDVWLVVTATDHDSPNERYTREVRHWDGRRWETVTLAGLPQNWVGSILLIHRRPWLIGEGVTYSLDPPAAFVASYGTVRGTPHWSENTVSRFGSLDHGYVRSASDAWAVGGTSESEIGYADPNGIGLAEHWDGKRWHRTPIPRPVSTLSAVAAAGRKSAMAVGTSEVSARSRKPVSYLWNGHVWRSIAAPPNAGRLSAVAPDGRGGYWAAGESATDRTHTVYYHYRSGHWITVQGPRHVLPKAPKRQRASITALVRGSGSVWSSGYVAAHGCDDEDGCPDDTAGQLIVDRRRSA